MLALGTVQFGLDYGISNRAGRTPLEEVARMLALAEGAGIQVLDTAALYGSSETVLGQALSPNHSFRIVTKTPQFRRDRLHKADAEVLVRAFRESLRKLNQARVYGLLVHHAADLLTPGGDSLFVAMTNLKAEGLVTHIGASTYVPEEVDRLMAHYDLDLIQVPLNLLDQRLIVGGQFDRLNARGIEIHARSVFLQGLLLMPLHEVPAYFHPILPLLTDFQRAMAELGVSHEAGALAFIRQSRTIDHVILGQATLKQLGANIDAYRTDFPRTFDFDRFACNDPAFVDPSRWKVV